MNNEPRWVKVDKKVRLPGVTAGVADWLFDEGSLTQRLKKCWQDTFRVAVLSQSWQLPLASEREALGMKSREYGLVRQVYLFGGGQPVVFARTIIPKKTLKGRDKLLQKLGQKPLGALLFSGQSVQRRWVEVTGVTPGQRLYSEAVSGLKKAPEIIWARRSLFQRKKGSLLVNEFFLPAAIKISSDNDV